MLNFRGKDEEMREVRLRDRLRVVDCKFDMSEIGRESEPSIATVVLSIEEKTDRN